MSDGEIMKEEGRQALYLQVKSYIRARIQSGALAPGSRVPSENELVQELKLSRMTVHRALRELAAEGLIRRVAGSGTFVSDGKSQSSLLHVSDIAGEIRSRGGRYSCEVILQREESADAGLAERLEIAMGEKVYHLVCIHKENHRPVQLEDRFVNPEAAPNFIHQNFTQMLPGAYLLAHVPLEEVEHMVEALRASHDEAAGLQIPIGEPCLVLTRRTWSAQRVVTLVRCVHAGARYRLGSRFKPISTEGLG